MAEFTSFSVVTMTELALNSAQLYSVVFISALRQTYPCVESFSVAMACRMSCIHYLNAFVSPAHQSHNFFPTTPSSSALTISALVSGNAFLPHGTA